MRSTYYEAPDDPHRTQCPHCGRDEVYDIDTETCDLVDDLDDQCPGADWSYDYMADAGERWTLESPHADVVVRLTADHDVVIERDGIVLLRETDHRTYSRARAQIDPICRGIQRRVEQTSR